MMPDYLDQIDAWATSSKPVAVPVAAILAACGEVRRLRTELAEADELQENYNLASAERGHAQQQLMDLERQLAEARAENLALRQREAKL